MNTSTWGDTCFKGIQNPDTTSIHTTADQVYPVSPTYTKSAVPLSAASKAALKFLSSNGVYVIRGSSLFIDTRKQQVFDWQKNTNAYQRIVHLSDLEDKWDGYDAPKFSKEQIDLALNLYSNLRTYCINRGLDFSKVEPFIAPCSDGMVLFEWAGKRFPFRQLEIYIPLEAEDKLEYLKTEGNSDIEGEFYLEEVK
ncbi:hypothetical protein [Brasilonema sp. UFV-L1]|uniref:hypothetical protein n=1 Tax=Brasilonema sp. UFV-L1 TaxID=2234130 RepID=UPI00145D9526|nr:hypothetical protein [Brasilonema sp. UFV-L1]NMG09031.1 hypothetical protein [Brasilonema sp. UFV-L1]